MESLNPGPESRAWRWAIAWERQILLELLRDAEPDRELDQLRDNLTHRELRNIRPAFPGPQEIATKAYRKFRIHFPTSEDAAESLSKRLHVALEQELQSTIDRLESCGAAETRRWLEQSIHPELLFACEDDHDRESDTATPYWGMWHPGLANDDQRLDSVIATLPGVGDNEIPREVRELEDPASTQALAGAVSLTWHDAIHVLLGRGLLDQDEAFVIGFTMGNASDFRDADAARMKHAFAHRYPEPFRVQGQKLHAFDLGIAAGQSTLVRDVALREKTLPKTALIRDWRQALGISTDHLRSVYGREQREIPGTLESARLPVL